MTETAAPVDTTRSVRFEENAPRPSTSGKDDEIDAHNASASSANLSRDHSERRSFRRERAEKIGHRRVDSETGEVTYKKVPTSQIINAIQFAITNSLATYNKAPDRDLLMQDFDVIEKFSFPSSGTATSPPHPYGDFRFKTYAPVAFKYFRDLFQIKFEDFLSSVCGSPMVELVNPGASGSIFYRSYDDQFILKTVQSKEAEFLTKLLPGYFMNLQQNPRTLLPKFFGLYCYQNMSKNIRLIVMNNLLPSSIRIHVKYDLKGSTYKRKASKFEREKKSPTLKDLDFLDDHPEGIFLEGETYDALIRTISRDCLVLEAFKIMDYSLLIGIHNIDQEKRDKSGVTADDCQPSTSQTANHVAAAHRPWHKQKSIMMNQWDEKTSLSIDGEEYPPGVPARNAKGDRLILYMGIIDILQCYRIFKKFEHAWKSVLHDGATISVHRPNFYADRFRKFIGEKVFRKSTSRRSSMPEKSSNKTVGDDAVLNRQNRKFRNLVHSFLGVAVSIFDNYLSSIDLFAALKHSPSKRKARERSSLGAAGRQQAVQSTDDEAVTTSASVAAVSSTKRDSFAQAMQQPQSVSTPVSVPPAASGNAVPSAARAPLARQDTSIADAPVDSTMSTTTQSALMSTPVQSAGASTLSTHTASARRIERLFASTPPPPEMQRVDGDSNIAGLLVSAVRALATSATEEQRELEKQRLLSGHAETTAAIDHLVTKHQGELQECLSSFSQVSSRVTACRERLQNARNNISLCKSLLQCKRDELKQLWRENAEQRRVVEIIERVEEIRAVTREVEISLTRGFYLRAAQSLMRTANTVESDLSTVDALNQIRHDVKRLSEEVYERCLSAIDVQLYSRPCAELRSERRSIAQGVNALLARHEHAQCSRANENDQPQCDENGQPLDDLTRSSPPVQHMAVLCDALGALGRMNDALVECQRRAHAGLWHCVQSALKEVERVYGAVTGDAEESKRLAEALQLLFRLFNTSVTLHSIMLQQVRRVAVAHNVHKSTSIYKVDVIYNEIQKVLVQLLEDYLGMSPAASAFQLQLEARREREQQTEPSGHDISAYFAKKSAKQRWLGFTTLSSQQTFRLAQTSHALNVMSTTQSPEQSPRGDDDDEDIELPAIRPLAQQEHVWVCAPSYTNVSVLFKPVTKYSNDIRLKMTSQASNTEPSKLSSFLDKFVRETFMPHIEQSFRHRADAITQSNDMWTLLVDSDEQRQLGADVPLLMSSARTLSLCKEVSTLMQALPPISANLAALWLLFLTSYSQRTNDLYEHITRPRSTALADNNDARKISANWAADEDISRLLKSLPNWTNLVATPATPTKTPIKESTRASVLSPGTPGPESADQIRERNRRESEILMSNLGNQRAIDEREITSDMNQIRALATMHESLEWLVHAMRAQLRHLPPATQEMLRTNNVVFESSGERSEQQAIGKALENRLEQLQTLAATCLLMLHLEVRVHCFFYLLPVARQSTHVPSASQSQEADARVQQLSQQLIKLHHLLHKHLQQRKLRYIFEGIAHLVASIFIHGSNHIQRINDNGKKRMHRNIYTLQQTLSSITHSRETDLDHAQAFFELLYKTPDQILDEIRDRGAKFTELEYRYLLSLAVRSHGHHELHSLEHCLTRLSEIMRQQRSAKTAT